MGTGSPSSRCQRRTPLSLVTGFIPEGVSARPASQAWVCCHSRPGGGASEHFPGGHCRIDLGPLEKLSGDKVGVGESGAYCLLEGRRWKGQSSIPEALGR